ncbi:MAG: hypothetical protein A3I24_02300 [Candidatus Harrisonbacteria bacterium RIFCSPLOWO2_02_FULL_41_13b]|uniref:Cell division protein FtsX n=1 Tax=Candidatus Harrisonbacteria bacterium RIFCSPLOWO2_02_FULL_41_13b TaxID=1798409 RepID=A0A1G1ZR97_9BACT|nr:MAG: hypothetical protein A3J53_03355 [Candidatus Harrisonbacteria bacterium RIFCSPHIGHO2_02_FULL_40_20]OGY67233.1 MAG: hypothetical protein A3I24_02300 [Candidatus Harrisonbacteria bacterium RIFCSPLOWO2_02_FULL_41_13b]
MATTLARIIKYGVQNFLRNGWLSAVTILVMVLALFVFNSLVIFNFLTDSASFALKDKIDISVYFKEITGEDDILKVGKNLEALPEVRAVEYISKENALKIFSDAHKEDVVISSALEELGGNPLLASLNVKAKDPNDYDKIASYLENSSFFAAIEKVTYAQNQLVINRLAQVVNALENVGISVVIVLALIASLVTFNTIRLGIYSNREELGIMRLVGASNKYIRGPYIVNGILYGIIAGVLSLVIAAPIVSLASPYLSAFMPDVSLSNYFYGNLSKLLGYQLMFGMLLGSVSSVIAVRRYLKI